jgi:hypothetical protein
MANLIMRTSIVNVGIDMRKWISIPIFMRNASTGRIKIRLSLLAEYSNLARYQVKCLAMEATGLYQLALAVAHQKNPC